ncbi:RNA recognition motif family protein [Acanthocheilonema viteae]
MSWIIRLQRLPLSANAADIRSFFAGLRIPDGAVHIVGGPDGDAFIGFATDEDARQAMRFDNRRIHDQRVRLLLSSRVEMDAVIAKARAGDLNVVGVASVTSVGTPSLRRDSSPAARPGGVQVPPVSTADSFGNQRVAQSQPAATDVYATRNGGHGQQDYARANVSGDGWDRASNVPLSDSWKSGSQGSYESRAANRQATATTTTTQAHSIGPWQDPKMLNVLGQTTQSSSVYQQSNRDERFGQYDQDNNFQGYNASVQAVVTATVASSAITQVPPIYQQTNVAASAVLPGQVLPLPPSIPGLLVPPLLTNTLPISAATATQPASGLANAHAFVARYTGRNGPAFSAMPAQHNLEEGKQNCYVELSRLPSELLRPAALEQFLRPSIPLTLSSVKVVFDPKGFPLHSLVRFECTKDAKNVLDRDGEQGIRIRSCPKEVFDNAVDGSLQIPPAFLHGTKEADYSEERSSRAGASLRHHRSPEKRDFDGRYDERPRTLRDHEDRYRASRYGRSRSPRDYRDYRDTKRRGVDPGRYCIEFTNLPFRVTEAEIREYLGPRCEPTKVTRAYNEDGQASDRWIAEFSTFDLAEKAYRVRGKINERPIRARRITNEDADQMLAVPDRFGRQKKEEYERKHGSDSSIAPLLDLPSRSAETGLHFQDPSKGRGSRGRGGLYRGGLIHGYHGEREVGDAMSSSGLNGTASSSSIAPPRFPTFRLHGGLLPGSRPRPPLISPPTFFGNTTPSTIRQRGPPPSGRGPPLLRGPRPSILHPPNNGPAGPIPAIPPPSVKSCLMVENVPENETDVEIAKFLQLNQTAQATLRRAADGIFYVDMGTMDEATKAVQIYNGLKLDENTITVTAITRQQMHLGVDKKVEPVEMLEPELIASVGEPGTVISCHGFPANVTLTDVAQFFDKYSLVESSVRIKLDDSGVPTGECLLAVGSPQEANKAVMLLSGRKLAGSTITMSVVRAATKQ